MKLPPWSYTFLSAYQNCPWQTWGRYIAKDVPFVETAAMANGTFVHNAMDKRISAGVPLPDQLKNFEPWAKGFDGKKVETEVRLGVRENGSICGF